MSKAKPIPPNQRNERLSISYFTATYPALEGGGKTAVRHKRYSVAESAGVFVVFDLMNGEPIKGSSFKTRKDAVQWMEENTAP
jgi:hypothetical protein